MTLERFQETDYKMTYEEYQKCCCFECDKNETCKIAGNRWWSWIMYESQQKINTVIIGEIQMKFILCYTDNGNNIWEEIIGEDAMQLRVGELADEELHCDVDDIIVFEKTDQW